jgi:hypothetical protein
MSETALNADEPEIVYHYTTMDTMVKIVENATIWATSINYPPAVLLNCHHAAYGISDTLVFGRCAIVFSPATVELWFSFLYGA